MDYIREFEILYRSIKKEDQEKLIKHISKEHPILSYASEGMYSGPSGGKITIDGIHSGPSGTATFKNSAINICPNCKRPL